MALVMRNELAKVELEALTASTEKALEWDENDDRTILVVSATSQTDITVKQGNGIQGVTDIKFTVPIGTSLIKLDSGMFKNVTGTNKGKIVVVSTGTPSVGIVSIV